MSTYETTSELRSLLQEEVNDSAPTAATLSRYLGLLIKAHRAVVAGGGELNLDDSGNPIRRPFIFPWALSSQPKVLTLLPKQEGTADVTQLSSSVLNCSINSGTTDLTGYHIRFGDINTVYRISAHSGTTLTLDGPALSESSVGLTFEAFKLIYSLGSGDILLPTDKLRAYAWNNEGYWISMVDSRELFDKWPLLKAREANPQAAAILAQSAAGNLTLQFSHAPSKYQRVELWYVPVPTDLTVSGVDPIMPKHHRTLLVHLAAFYHLQKRDDDRAQEHFNVAKRLFDVMTTEARQIMNANDAKYGAILPWAGGFSNIGTREVLIDFE